MVDRYNVVSEDDLDVAAERVAAYVTKRSTERPRVVALSTVREERRADHPQCPADERTLGSASR